MTDTPAVLDETRQRAAREYARRRRRVWALGILLTGLLLFGLVLTGATKGLIRYIDLRADLPWWGQVAAVGIAVGGLVYVFNLPLDFYAGFVLPHRVGLSNQTLSGWIGDAAKSGLISAAIGLPMLVLVYGIIRMAGSGWWLWAGLATAGVTVVLATLAPILFLPVFYRFRPLAEDQRPLADRLARLAASASVQVRGVYSFDLSRRTKAANALLVGAGPTRRILLGDTLLETFTPDEAETVLAHELGHHVHRDVPLGILVQSALQMAHFYLAGVVLRAGILLLGLTGPADPAGLPLLALTIGLLGLVSLPLGNAYSRSRESMADSFALRLSGKPQAFASAMTRLANQNLADADPEPWVVWLLHSHPPLHE
ncbi:MAG: M48 family metallopeptidase, partial [Anaerolineales bacterium]